MNNIPMATGTRPTYENFVVDCPVCGKENVFNRASDLLTFEAIGGLDVSCLNNKCGERFRIVGDSVNEAYEMFIHGCQELRDRKHYMYCVLCLAQSYEVFFALFFRVELLYKPFGADSKRDLKELNRLATTLNGKIKGHAFRRLRALFLRHVIARQLPNSVAEAARVVDDLPRHPTDPNDNEIAALDHPLLVPLLGAIKTTKVLTLRNRVVHESAYRPSLQEVEDALEEARSILFPLGHYFNLHDDINWYTKNQWD